MFSIQGISPSLMVFPRTNENITTRSDNIQLVQSWFVTHTNKLEELYFVDKELKGKQKWSLYEHYGVLQKIFQKPL